MVKGFKEVSFTYVPRTQNQFADALATLASIIQLTEGIRMQPLEIQVEEEPAFCTTISEEPWYYDIKTLLQTGSYPEKATERDRRALRRLAGHFLLSGTTLYRRSFDTTLLRYIDEKEAKRLVEEVHEGVCGPHMNGHMLARKIMRMGYFWLTIESDCIRHVRHCHLCQIYANKINALPKEL